MNILIIDATNLLYRMHHALGASQRHEMVPAYMRCMNKYMQTFDAHVTYAVSDKRLMPGEKNYRRQHACYKQTRDSSAWQTVHASEPQLECMMQLQGIRCMYPGIMEADDVIAFLCTCLTGNKTIVSTDHDMAQLIAPDVQLYSPVKKIVIHADNFEQHFPVPQSKYLLYKSILGDASDNIAGLPAYGKVKAKRLAENFDTEFHKLPAHLQQQQQHNMHLMDLSQACIMHPEERTCYEQQLHAWTCANNT
jgi:DNA polymerase-1